MSSPQIPSDETNALAEVEKGMELLAEIGSKYIDFCTQGGFSNKTVPSQNLLKANRNEIRAGLIWYLLRGTSVISKSEDLEAIRAGIYETIPLFLTSSFGGDREIEHPEITNWSNAVWREFSEHITSQSKDPHANVLDPTRLREVFEKIVIKLLVGFQEDKAA